MVVFEKLICDDIMKDTYKKKSKILGLDIYCFRFYDHLKFEICRKIATSEKYKIVCCDPNF